MASLHTIAFSQSLFSALAEHLFAEPATGTDLSQHTIVLAEPRHAAPLRHSLLQHARQHGGEALLGPYIVSLPQWISRFQPNQQPVSSEPTRQLILIKALLAHPDLLGNANVWALAENVLQLFDELTLNRIELPRDPHSFARQLAKWYRLGANRLSAQTREANMIHQLWLAWHAQLKAQRVIDSRAAYVLALANSLDSHNDATGSIHLVGIEPSTRVERHWLRAMLKQDAVHWWQHGGLCRADTQHLADPTAQSLAASIEITLPIVPAQTDYDKLLDIIFSPAQAPLHDRVHNAHRQLPVDPFAGRLATLAAPDAEHEAHAVELQVRRWLLDGMRRIAVVTENRRLARRVRALLERADILLHDSAGWVLSTTRAAAALEAWLQCIEEDFAYIPLLDLLKSSFIFTDRDDSEIKAAAYRLERDIIQHENIARGLDRYRQFILDRRARLSELWPEPPSHLLDLLQRLQHASQTLAHYRNGQHNASQFITALHDSLQQLAMDTALQRDAAGQQLLHTLEQLSEAARGSDLAFGWLDFRAWLGRVLETTYFRPIDTGSPVQLLTLAQAQLQSFDAVIIAGAETEYLPGKMNLSPFFNETVRRELHLPGYQTLSQTTFRQFYALLHSAPTILLSYRVQQDGEWVARSPWVEAIETFYAQCYGRSLQDLALLNLMQQPDSLVVRGDGAPLPARATAPLPKVALPLLPNVISYSDLQKLFDCPYQFYAARCLNLTASEDIQQVLSKREYGERVHQCLQAFFVKVAGLPGPFAQAVTAANREHAIALLEQISEQVFAQDLRDNFIHRGWFRQWHALIPKFIDWQLQRHHDWRVWQVEYRQQVALESGLSLKGQVDRIDASPDGLALIDYKTGALPSQKEILAGEKIQLAFYTLLLQQAQPQPVLHAAYLQLDETMKSKINLDTDTLAPLAQQLAEQVSHTFAELQRGQPLPAWQDKKICSHCTMETLCRRQMWEDTARQ